MADPVQVTSIGDFIGLIVGGGSGVGGGALVYYMLTKKLGAVGENCSPRTIETLDRVFNQQGSLLANQGKIIAVQQQMAEQLDRSNDAIVQVANAISGLRGFLEGRMSK